MSKENPDLTASTDGALESSEILLEKVKDFAKFMEKNNRQTNRLGWFALIVNCSVLTFVIISNQSMMAKITNLAKDVKEAQQNIGGFGLIKYMVIEK